MATISSVWKDNGMYHGEVESMFYNNMFGYYLGGANWAMLEDIHGKNSAYHQYQLKTFANTMINCGNFTSRCLHYPSNLPHRSRCQMEQFAEEHFSATKSFVRGAPKNKDMIYGSSGTNLSEVNII